MQGRQQLGERHPGEPELHLHPRGNGAGEVGIKADLLSAEKALFFGGYAEGGPCATGEYDIFEYSTIVGGFPDPHSSEWLCSEIPTDAAPEGSNWQAVCDPTLDGLVKKRRS